MSINRAEQTLDQKLVADVTQLQRDMREIKSKQPIGADVLQIVSAPAGLPLIGGPFFIAFGQSSTINITTAPTNSVLQLWNFAFTVYVDLYDNDHQWPSGSALTASTREISVFNWLDWADSSDTTNARVYKIRIRNSDPTATDHSYYIAFKSYFPKGTQ